MKSVMILDLRSNAKDNTEQSSSRRQTLSKSTIVDRQVPFPPFNVTKVLQ